MVDTEVRPPQSPESFINTTFQRRLAQREAQAGILPADRLLTVIDRRRQYDRLAKMIGHTPLLLIEQIGGSNILAKVESQNPTESHYDRAYLATLKRLEEDGVIKPGDELLETTSGSAGTSFAWLASRLGYRARIMVPNSLPQGRKQEMVNFGATVQEIEGYVPEVVKTFRKELMEHKKTRQGHQTDVYNVQTYEKEDGTRVCAINHSANRLSVEAFHAIGEEIKAVLPLGTNPDYILSILGNWTTTTAFIEEFPDSQIIGIEDKKQPVQFVKKNPGKYEEQYGQSPTFDEKHEMYGSSAEGTPLVFPNVDALTDIVLADGEVTKQVRDEFNMGKPVIETIGSSSAASLNEARRLGQQHPGSTILIFFYDKSDRYGVPVLTSTTDIWTSQKSPVTERARLLNVGWEQKPVKNLRELPSTLIDPRAGGKSRVYESWALS